MKTLKIWGGKREEITDTQIYSTHLLFFYIYIKILYTFEAKNRTLLHVYLKHNKIKSISQTKFVLQYYGDRRQRI